MPDSSSVSRVRTLRREAWDAGAVFANAFTEAFPVGSSVDFRRGKGQILARVLEHSRTRNMEVQVKIYNVNTRNSYWVSCHTILNGVHDV